MSKADNNPNSTSMNKFYSLLSESIISEASQATEIDIRDFLKTEGIDIKNGKEQFLNLVRSAEGKMRLEKARERRIFLNKLRERNSQPAFEFIEKTKLMVSELIEGLPTT
jgi:hypothetical protein